MYDVAVIGGGIVGTAAAAYRAEAGATVVLFEQAVIGAGASGRNSGAIQHPYDHLFAQLHHASLPLYRDLAAIDPEFKLAPDPDGMLLVTLDAEAARAEAVGLLAATPELRARFVSADEMHTLEPALAAGVAGVWLDTGYAVAPASATQAFARRAAKAGAETRIGVAAGLGCCSKRRRTRFWSRPARGRLTSSPAGARSRPSRVRGEWSQRWPPPLPRAVILEELSIDASGSEEPFAFSLMTAGTSTSLGSTFLPDEPEVTNVVDQLRSRGRWFVPAIGDAPVLGVRVCARPVPFDGRPLIGPLPGLPNVYVCAGHGPWGISTGPGAARLIADVILGDSPSRIPAGLSVARLAAA